MAQRRAILWCKLKGQRVEVILELAHPEAAPASGVPRGRQVRECISRSDECYGTGCPMTTDGGECPFGELGELPDGPPEQSDPSVDGV